MKQFLFIASLSASLLFGQGTPSPAKPGATPPPPPSPQEVLAGRPASSAAAPAVAPDKVVLTIGDQKVTAKEFDSYIDGLPEQVRAQARGPMKRQMAEQIVRVKLLSDQARKQGLDQDPAVKARVNFQIENLLAGAAYNDLLTKVKVDDASALKYFEEHKNEWDEVSARHILIKFKGSPVPVRQGQQEISEEQALAKAQEIKKKLDAGGDFATLAKAESDDTGSGANGGDLGTFKRNSMVAEFEKTAFSLPVGKVSDPIKTQFGYHIIKVEKHNTPSIDSVRPQIDERVKPEMARQSVEVLAKNTNVVMDDAFFGPAQAPTMAPSLRNPGGGGSVTPAPKPSESLTAPPPPGTSKPTAPKPKPVK